MPPARSTRKTRATPAPDMHDVIELDAHPTVPAKRKPRTTDSEVIEISSDDDNDVPHYEQVRANRLEREVKKLKAELLLAEEDKKRMRKERNKLREDVKSLQGNVKSLEINVKSLEERPIVRSSGSGDQETVAISMLEDDLTCEICSLKMWRPYILPKCGHTFCESCLHDWFQTITNQHKVAHPHYNPNVPLAIPNFLRDAVIYNKIAHRQLTVMVAQLDAGGPNLTCPTCREQVKTRPIESFALKSLVRAVAGAQGEESPQKPTQKATTRGKRAAVPAPRDPWAAFF